MPWPNSTGNRRAPRWINQRGALHFLGQAALAGVAGEFVRVLFLDGRARAERLGGRETMDVYVALRERDRDPLGVEAQLDPLRAGPIAGSSNRRA